MKAKITVEPAQENKQEDIFVPGNVVVSKNDDAVVLVTSSTEYKFNGVTLHCPLLVIGKLENGWDKHCFVQFRGRVVLDI